MLEVGIDLEPCTPAFSTGRSLAGHDGKTALSSTPRPFTHGVLVTWGAWKDFEGKIAAHGQLKMGVHII